MPLKQTLFCGHGPPALYWLCTLNLVDTKLASKK